MSSFSGWVFASRPSRHCVECSRPTRFFGRGVRYEKTEADRAHLNLIPPAAKIKDIGSIADSGIVLRPIREGGDWSPM